MEGCLYELLFSKKENKKYSCISDHPHISSICCLYFVNGKDVNLQNGSGHFTIKVARTDPDGTELDLDLDWEEYLIGVLAYEMPESYELEALKAQAVVLRTSLCRELAENEEKTATEKYLTHAEMKRKWGAANFDTYLKNIPKQWKIQKEQWSGIMRLVHGHHIINPVTVRHGTHQKFLEQKIILISVRENARWTKRLRMKFR